MALTRKKYNKELQTNFETSEDMNKVVDTLGEYESLISKYNLECDTLPETLNNLERSLMLGQSGKERIDRAIGKKVYYLIAKKKRKAILKGYAEAPQPLDMMVIERKGEIALMPWSRLYVSRHEAKRAKKNIQIYKLSSEAYAKFFKDKKERKTYLIEVKKGTDLFMVYERVFHGYYRTMLNEAFTLSEIKDKFGLDIEVFYAKKRNKFKTKQARHLNN